MVELSIFDVLGRHIRTITRDVLPEGVHSVVWDGADDQGRVVSSGVYYSRLATAGYTSTNKLLMMK
jgi:flagellar hook assembly protein FlgD